MAMDEQRVRTILNEILHCIGGEGQLTSQMDSSSLPKAYFIFPDNWQSYESSQYAPVLKAVEGKYQKVIVLPEHDAKSEECFSRMGACMVTVYSDLHAPDEGSITVFPLPCRNLVVKTALCLSGDFVGCWIRQCIERGLHVYMKKEEEMFTGQEPAAYRRKILSYYKDMRSYGICFVEDGNSYGNNLKDVKAQQAKPAKGRFITTRDLRDLPKNAEYKIHPGDVLTALAKEHVKKFGIRIVEE